MTRMMIQTAIAAALLTSYVYQPAQAQHIYHSPGKTTFNGVPSRFIQQHQARPISFDNHTTPDSQSNTELLTEYPQLNSPLYPAPRQDIPLQVGGTAFTNHAFAPHEMLYRHTYRGLYPPYFYEVKGWYIWTPLGAESHDNWDLRGTEVTVKYRTSISPFARLANSWLR